MATTSDLINDARGYAAQTLTDARALVTQAESAIGNLDGRFIISGPTFDPPPPIDITTNVPEFPSITFDPGQAPAAPTDLVNLPTLDAGTAPVNDAVNPGFVEPAKPSQLAPLDATAPAINTSFDFPAVPDALGSIDVVAPTLAERTVPDAPQFQLPEFTAMAPTDDITPPDDFVAQFEAAYRGIGPTMTAAIEGQVDAWLSKINPRFAQQMAALEDKITAYMAGGTALAPTVENAIYERARDKNSAEYRRARDTAYADAARRGFTLPSGALLSAVQQARQAGADNNARAAVEIAVKQAELEQQNIQFAITTSSQLRTSVLSASLNYHQNLIGINAQALDYAKSILSAMIDAYDVLVKAYGMRLDAYKAEAAVYETRLRGVLALIEIYQAELAGLETLARLDVAKIDIYKARLEGLNILGNVYRTQIDAVIGKASLEKMKIELFGEQVRAYGVLAQAKNAEWQGYSAAVSGQEARMRAYGEEVRAFSVLVDARRAEIQAKQAEIQSVTSYNQGILAQYTAQVEGYKVATDAKARVASTQIDLQRTQLVAFQAKVGAEESKARLVESYYRTKLTLGQEGFRSVLQATVSNADITTKQIEAVANTALNGARIYTGVASSALAGMNTLVTHQDPSS